MRRYDMTTLMYASSCCGDVGLYRAFCLRLYGTQGYSKLRTTLVFMKANSMLAIVCRGVGDATRVFLCLGDPVFCSITGDA